MNFEHPNFNALSGKVTYLDLLAWRAEQKRTYGSSWTDPTKHNTSMQSIGVLVPAGVLCLYVLGNEDIGGGSLASALIFKALIVIAIALFAVIMLVRFVFTKQTVELLEFRFFKFAQDNGLQAALSAHMKPYPGMVFSLGDHRGAEHVLTTLPSDPRFTELGDFWYQADRKDDDGNVRRTPPVHWGYVAIRLDHALPNIVLDAKANNRSFDTNLPERFSHDQILHLEGDFDRYFTLYTPKGYETDALYLFTPEVMATFIDQTSAFDAEIVDDWLFLYTDHEIMTLEPAATAKIFTAVAAIRARTARWGHWRDERLGEDPQATARPLTEIPTDVPSGSPEPHVLAVAQQGKRLRKKTSRIWTAALYLQFRELFKGW